MRSPDAAQGAAAAFAAWAGCPGFLAKVSAACIGAPLVRTTARAAVTPNTTTAAIRQPSGADALILAPLRRSARYHIFIRLPPACLGPSRRTGGMMDAGPGHSRADV